MRQVYSTGSKWEELAAFSRAVRVGDQIWVAGTTASGPDGIVGEGDPAAQAEFIYDKIQGALEALGGQLSDVVRTRVFVRDIADWEAVARVHGQRFARIRPVNTLVEARMVAPEMLVEIEVDAVIGAGPAA